MQITPISTPMFPGVTVNAYLLEDGADCFLIDTGLAGQRRAVNRQLEQAGCQPDNLRLIALTHGDFDHSGNAAHLRSRFGVPIAMHRDDAGMVEQGDMFWNRKRPGVLLSSAIGLVLGLRGADRFSPDIYLEDEHDLSEHGLDARVVHLPGHSRGSVGFLTGAGDLFCGDLLGNTRRPEVWSLIDDAAAMRASADRVRDLGATMVYPGHGRPFALEEFARIVR